MYKSPINPNIIKIRFEKKLIKDLENHFSINLPNKITTKLLIIIPKVHPAINESL